MLRLCSILFVFVAASAADAQSVTLRHTPVSGELGDIVSAKVLMDTDFSVAGWSYGVCVDPNVVEMVGAQTGSTTATIMFGNPPAVETINFDSDSVTHFVIICSFGCSPLPPGDDYELLDLDYQMVGVHGTSGDICFCETGVPPTPIGVSIVGASTIVPANECTTAEIPPCTDVVPNRSIDTFEILPRAGDPGRFDVVVEWAVETSTPLSDLSTIVMIEVGTAFTISQSHIADPSIFVCCEEPFCGDTCGLWFTGTTTEAGICELSPTQQLCTCRLARTATFFDLEILEGQSVTARLLPMSIGVSETITSDDAITRLAPFFNRELIRTAWIPDPSGPGAVLGYAFYRIIAQPVDAAVDFGFDLMTTVGGSSAGQTEVIIKIPDGVEDCALEDCGSECSISENAAGKCIEIAGDCDNCTQADVVPLGTFLTLGPGTPYEIEMIASPDALPEASGGDDVIAATYVGFKALPNRNVRAAQSSLLPALVPDHVNVELAWRAETGGFTPEDVSVRFLVEVNGVEHAIVDSQVVVGVAGSSCASCSSAPCGTWTVDGSPVVANCAMSDEQGLCVCGIDLVTTLPLVPMLPGDSITVTLLAGVASMAEALTVDNSITFQGTSTFVRGDSNADGNVDLADAISLLVGLFESGPIPCDDSSDVDDDGILGIADPIVLLSFLFQGDDQPVGPYPSCGNDPTADTLGCGSFPPCP